VDSLLHDFGPVGSNTQTSHRFKITNAGSAPLQITKVNTPCGCTSSVVGETTVAPGQSTELAVTFNSAGLKGLSRKTVEVISNDPANPSQIFSIQAEVAADITPEAADVLFQDLVPRDRRKQSVKFTTGTGRPIHVVDADLSEAPWLGVATRERDNNLWVDLDLLARRLPAASLSGTDTITLHVLNPLASTVKLSVHWERRAPVVATPVKVAWAEPAGQELSASVRLQSRDHKSFRILSARTTNPLLQVSGISPRASASQAIQLLLSPTAPPGGYEDKVILTLDTPGHPEFEIRVAASLR
jgi:Protein of unknown function (DUF1573)